MRTFFPLVVFFLASALLAAEPKVHRDLPYAELRSSPA